MHVTDEYFLDELKVLVELATPNIKEASILGYKLFLVRPTDDI